MKITSIAPTHSPINIENKESNLSFKEVLSSSLKQFDKMWKQGQANLESSIKNISPEYSGILKAQLLASNCNFQTELVTKSIDAVQSSIKKLQQQN